MLEIIEDAFLLHQTRNKIEISLPILNTVVPLLIAALQTNLEMCVLEITKVLENRLNDLRGLLALKETC